MAVANNYNTVAAYSIDGINWTQTTMPTSVLWESVCYGGGKFVATAWNSVAAYSTDGITWTQTTMPASARWDSVCYGNGKFVAVGGSATAFYSCDGITWTRISMPDITSATQDIPSGWFKTVEWSSVCYGDGKFVATGELYYEPDDPKVDMDTAPDNVYAAVYLKDYFDEWA